MSDTEPRVSGPTPVHTTLLWYALTGGVVWWALHLTASSVLVPVVCDRGGEWTIHLTTGVTLAGALSALWASFAVRRDQTAVELLTQRTQFLSVVAVWFNIAAVALIVLEGIPPFFLSECAR